MASAAQDLMQKVNTVFGSGTMKMGNDPYWEVKYLPVGLVPVDDALQGGIPLGRFIEIYGDYSTLKSYIGLCAIKSFQQAGKLAALIDTEHAYDPKWAKEIGVDTSDLILRQPPNGEEAIDIAEALIRGGVDLIVFDSVAAALPKAEQEKSLSKDSVQPARLAALMSLAMRKLTAANSKTAVLWINQTRMNVGVMFGSNESVPGGKALPFYASYRLSVRKAGAVFEEVNVYVSSNEGKPVKKKVKLKVAQNVVLSVEKSKLNAPNRSVHFTFRFREGAVDEWQYLANLALDEGMIATDRGYWWVVGEKTKQRILEFRGRIEIEALKEMLKEKVVFLGGFGPDRKKAEQLNGKSSKRVVRVSTRTVGRAKSRKTVVIKKRSMK